MNLNIPLPEGLALSITDEEGGGDYPTRRLQKGLLLAADGRLLTEEGVGFGVPILKRGVQTIFPGSMDLAWRRRGRLWDVTAIYDLCLVERLARRRADSPIQLRLLYAAKDSLAALHRRSPRLRGLLTATSSVLRRTFGWVTTYEEAGFHVPLEMKYTIDGVTGRVDVGLTPIGLPAGITEVVVMNEQGGRSFDVFVDSSGAALRGPEIATWDDVPAARAAFVSTTDRVLFSLGQADGARLRRGRELVGSRLAWAGFGYSLSPAVKRFGYDMRIERTS